jgi:bifunctional DNA-binding transcriptional regulator/antitoxin component of YhaV-PrlF toxin-antitoxin module
MTTTISSKGQFVLPATIRKQDRVLPGQRFAIQRLEAGEYLLQRQESGTNAGLVDWLLACPDKGWFQEIESESTDSL